MEGAELRISAPPAHPAASFHGGAIMLSMMVATFTLLSAALANYWDQRKHL
jgi:hypothetical protein